MLKETTQQEVKEEVIKMLRQIKNIDKDKLFWDKLK